MVDEKMIEETENTEHKNVSQQKPENFVERIYDHIPLTYKQVDIFTKAMIALLVIVLAVAIIDAR